ncbi:MAG: excinuclease ABC subunit UvrC [Rhodospirillaceae bacterium]
MPKLERQSKFTEEENSCPSVIKGPRVIKTICATLNSRPGVYRMIDQSGAVLYVGKARNLRRRVTAYTQLNRHPIRIQRMIAATARLEVIETHTEAEALLLESNLIKRLKPHYNILLRDDKSFPYILLTDANSWPRLIKHRGSQSEKGEYFGPFASTGAVNRTLVALQRAFPLRDCTDSVFNSRTRPCLQYQIKRCSGPCVGRISTNDYARIVSEARAFLTGQSRDLQQLLSSRMQEASQNLEFEAAAGLRDRIEALTQIQARQDINVANLGDADIIALVTAGGKACVQIFFFRNGQNFGNRTYFPSRTGGLEDPEIIAAFIGQFYANKSPPPLVLVNTLPLQKALIEKALGSRANRKVVVLQPVRGIRLALVKRALVNAREELARRMADAKNQEELFSALAKTFDLPSPPNRIEIYDNSHISGSHPVGAMVVASPQGFLKNSYRTFNIKDKMPKPGDDYAMMQEVIRRRFGRALREDPERKSGTWPDLMLIDGGRGQVSTVTRTLKELSIDDLIVIGISKGSDRNSSRERFYVEGQSSFILKPQDPVLYLVQRFRDEAHRFAIGSHRARRKKSISKSPLDQIPGIGIVRKRSLLNHFGSSKAIADAGLGDLESVKGISSSVAKQVYLFFHTDR